LTYNLRLTKVKVDLHAKNQGYRSNGSNRRVPTANGQTRTHMDKRTDTHTDATKRTRSIKMWEIPKKPVTQQWSQLMRRFGLPSSHFTY